MVDRKNKIYDSYCNTSLCQPNCILIYYDKIFQKVECECQIQKKETLFDSEEIVFDKTFIENFYKSLEHSNFLVMKCYKLIFSSEGQLGNKGSYIMSFILLIFIISFLWYFIKGKRL